MASKRGRYHAPQAPAGHTVSNQDDFISDVMQPNWSLHVDVALSRCWGLASSTRSALSTAVHRGGRDSMRQTTQTAQVTQQLKPHQRVVVIICCRGSSVRLMPIVNLVGVDTEDDEPVLVCLRLQCVQKLSVQLFNGAQMHSRKGSSLRSCPFHYVSGTRLGHWRCRSCASRKMDIRSRAQGRAH